MALSRTLVAHITLPAKESSTSQLGLIAVGRHLIFLVPTTCSTNHSARGNSSPTNRQFQFAITEFTIAAFSNNYRGACQHGVVAGIGEQSRRDAVNHACF